MSAVATRPLQKEKEKLVQSFLEPSNGKRTFPLRMRLRLPALGGYMLHHASKDHGRYGGADWDQQE